MKRNLTILLLLIASVTTAQIDTFRLNKHYLKKYWTDTKTIVASPTKWDGQDWKRFGLFAATTGALFFADEPVRDFAQDHRSDFSNNITKYGLEPFGVEYTIAFMGGLYGYSLLTKNRKSESTALLAAESFLLSAAFVRVAKIMGGRLRPDSYPPSGAFDFKGPFNGGTAFPSGHTIGAFAVATVVANQYRDVKWVPIASYSIATLAGLSRVHDNRHWISDVFAGAVFGWAIGNVVCPNNKKSNLSVIPFKSDSVYGVKLALSL